MKIRIWAGAALIALATSAHAAADYPNHPVTVVVPFPAGGSTDYVGRLVARELAEKLHGNFLVENRAGATGNIGTAYVARATPDGYTLLVSSLAPFAINPFLFKNLPYDPERDLSDITIAVQAPNVLVASPKAPGLDMPSLIAYEKKNPGKATFASSGTGASDHLTAELFWQATGTTGLHVPYKGGAPAVADLLGGQVQYSFQNVNAVLSYIQAGTLKAIAVTGDKRSAVLPNVPTMAEAGVNNVVVYSWQAVAAPKGLPADIKTKLNQAIVASLNEPETKRRLAALGFDVVGNTPEAFERFQHAELARWKKVIETGHISIN
jgi:tripartite-type tricarboxylate transporter receptor subunit TctC